MFWGHKSTFVCACGKSFASVSSLRKHWSWNGSGCMTGWFAFSLFLSLFMVLNDWCQCVVSDWWMDSHASWHCNKYCETLWLNSLFRWKQALNFAPVSPGVCIYITQPPCSSQQMGWTSLLCGRRGGGQGLGHMLPVIVGRVHFGHTHAHTRHTAPTVIPN